MRERVEDGKEYGGGKECVWFLLVVNISASDCLDRLVLEVIYYVLRGTLNSTHSLTGTNIGPDDASRRC